MMKALSLHQPWASLIGLGKVHETRSWRTSYRGPMLIHAAKKWDHGLAKLCDREPFFSALCAAGFLLPAKLMSWTGALAYFLPLGCVVSIADLVDCRRTPQGNTLADWPDAAQPRSKLDFDFGNWSAGRWAWELANVRRLPEPIPWPGTQGLWVPPLELVQAVEAAIAGDVFDG